MKLSALFDNVEMQGNFRIMVWNDFKEEYVIDEALTSENRKKYNDREIKYLYAQMNNETGEAETVIEVYEDE